FLDEDVHTGRYVVHSGREPHAPAVVPARDRLHHHRRPGPRGERGDVARTGDRRPPRYRKPQRGQALAHGALVLGVPERVRARQHRHTFGGKRVDQVTRHVLVVERDHVTALCELAQRTEVVVASDVDIGGDEGRAVIRRRGEDP